MASSQPIPTGDEVDISLRSEDGKVFKIKAYHLKSGSTVFRDMLSLPTPVNVNSIRNPPSPSTSSTENAIDIPADSGTLRIFIQLLEQGAVERISLFRSPFPVPGRRPRRTDSPGAPNPEAKPIEELTTLMDFLLRFDCSQAIQERAMHINHHVLYQDPWAGFVIAAKGNHMNHAREAIGHFHEVKGPATVDPGRMSLGAIKSIPIEWFAGYLRAVGAQKAALESPIIPTDDPARADFWENVSEIFDVAQ